MDVSVREKQYKVGTRTAVIILVMLSLLQLLDFADRSVLAIGLDAIKKTFSLTDAQAGMLPSLLNLGIAIMVIPTALLADRFARRKVIMAMSFIWSIFTLTTGLAVQIWHLFISRFMVGAGEAGYQPAGQTWLTVTFPKEQRGRVMAVFMAFFPIGTAVGLIVGGWLLTVTGDWRTAFFAFGIPGMILALLVLLLPDYKAVKQQGEGVLSKNFFNDWGEIFKIKTYVIYLCASAFIYMITLGGVAWVPVLLMRSYDMSAMNAGIVLALASLISLLAPLAGLAADRWQKRNRVGRLLFAVVAVLCYVAGHIGYSLLAGDIPIAFWVAIYLFYSLSMMAVAPSFAVLPHDVVPVKVRSTAIGTQTLISQLLGGMLGPVIVGAVSDALGGGAYGVKMGLFWIAPGAIISVVLVLVMMRYYPAESAKISDTVEAER